MLSFRRFFLIAILLLNSCGYHLRGAIDLPSQYTAIYLQSASMRLQRQFEIALRNSSARLVHASNNAQLIVQFNQEQDSIRTISISSSGRANMFELGYQIQFSLYDLKGQLLLDHYPLFFKRDYFNDQTDILAKSNEEELIRQELMIQAVQSIVVKIQSTLGNNR
jgi:LPS-assembly lipoprotein